MRAGRTFISTGKVLIALMSAISATAAFFLGGGATSCIAAITGLGVLLLACGAGGLNEYQERDLDGRMERTRKRPIPSGEKSPRQVLFLSIILVAAGLVILWAAGRGLPLLLGGFAVVWYNGVYTPLKRKTAFAAIVGAVAGAIPPMIGWTAGGGGTSDPRLAVLCLFLVLWQVPHFWLHRLRYEGEYESAGLPTLKSAFGPVAFRLITAQWIFALAASSAALLVAFGVTSPAVAVSVLAAILWIAFRGRTLLKSGATPVFYHRIAMAVNAYLFFVLVFVALGRTV